MENNTLLVTEEQPIIRIQLGAMDFLNFVYFLGHDENIVEDKEAKTFSLSWDVIDKYLVTMLAKYNFNYDPRIHVPTWIQDIITIWDVIV